MEKEGIAPSGPTLQGSALAFQHPLCRRALLASNGYARDKATGCTRLGFRRVKGEAIHVCKTSTYRCRRQGRYQ